MYIWKKSIKTMKRRSNKLTDEQCKDMKGIITKEEVLFTLRLMKKGRNPGSGGFTVDFYIFSWNDLCSFLVCSINYETFKKENLSSPQKETIITLLPKGDKTSAV